MENFKFYYKSLYSFFLESRGISETWEAWEQLTIEHFEAVNSTPAQCPKMRKNHIVEFTKLFQPILMG